MSEKAAHPYCTVHDQPLDWCEAGYTGENDDKPCRPVARGEQPASKPESGHDLAREIIAKHGRDRYPTALLVVLKLVEELGELTAELLREPAVDSKLRKEYGDVGLTLHALGNQLGLDLLAEMRAVVDGETRTFL